MLRLPAFGRALSHRNYRLYFIGQGISLMGTWMQQVALWWLVWETTRSAFLLGLVSFCGQIPTFFLAPVAGVLSDRLNRRRTLVIVQAASMIQSILMIALLAADSLHLWLIILLSIALGVAGAFDMPTRQAFMFDIAPRREDLPNAIALNSTMVNAARLVGPLAAGIIIAKAGPMVCFISNAFSYLAVLIALLAMRNLREQPQRTHPPVLRGLAEGVQYAFGFAPIRALLLLVALLSFAGMPITTLLPVFANHVLKGGPGLYGALLGASGVGALAAGIYLASRRTVVGLGIVIAWACGICGASIMAFGVSRYIPLSMALAAVTGMVTMLQLASTNTLLQTVVDDDKRGRVMSLYTLAMMGISPFGSLAAGAIANAFGAPVAAEIGGAVCIAGALAFARALPELRAQVTPIYQRVGVLPPIAVGLETSAEVTSPPLDPI